MAIADVFENVLGRGPTKAENLHFQKFLGSGDLTEYEIGQILGSLPEAQQKTLRTQGTEYENLLASGDQRVLGQAADVARGDIARRGLSDSSSFGSQLAQAGQNLASQRQDMLSDFYGRGLQGIRGAMAGLGGGAMNRGYGLRDLRGEREHEMNLAQYWYNRQQNDFNNYANAQRGQQRNALMGGLAGTAAGGLIGGYYSGSSGKNFNWDKFGSGALAGSRFGAGFGGLMGGY